MYWSDIIGEKKNKTEWEVVYFLGSVSEGKVL